MKLLRAEIILGATPAQVFEAFTSEAGVRAFFAPAATVSAIPGAPYELYFMLDAPEGSRGSEGCVVLAAERPSLLAVSWNFPPILPSLRDAGAQTRVEIRIEPSGQQTRVQIEQSGWQEGEDWDAGFTYFERAWGMVLERLAQSFASGPIDWSALD